MQEQVCSIRRSQNCHVQVALWLAHIQVDLNSRVGPFSLDYLRLQEVIEPVPLGTVAHQRRWWAFF